MRVLLIATTGIGPVDIGGPSTVAQFLTKYLAKNGVEVTLLIRGDKKKASKLKSMPPYDKLGVEMKNIDYNWDILLHPIKLAKALFLTYYWYLKEIKEYDVIIYNSPPTDILVLFPIISKLFSKKQIFIIHGGIFYEITSLYGEIGRALLRIYKGIFFDYVVGVSPVSLQIAYNFGFPRDKIKLIFNGIDLEIMNKIKPKVQNKKIKITYVGRLSKIKRVEDLILTLPKILPKYQNVEVYICGDGPLRAHVKKQVKSFGIDRYVHFTGHVTTLEGYEYIKSASIFVLTSEKENFPMTILEAMALKTPIIASNIEGTKYTLIHWKNAFLFPKGETNTLTKYLQYLISNPKFRKKFSLIGYKIVKKRYNWDTLIQKYIILIREHPERNPNRR